MVCDVEILCFGNELLIGKIPNSNAQWLSKQITSLGGKVRRITVIGDYVHEISTAINEAITRKPNFIIGTGGLGPTFDDKTLEGISEALNKPLAINKIALKMIEERYLAYGSSHHKKFELSLARIKMAKLPEGSKPVPNHFGTAPGILIKHEGITLVALPGVPQEMRSIFEDIVVPIIRKIAGNIFINEKSLTVTKIGESEIAPLIDITMKDNPKVYIKSHPKHSETGLGYFWTELHISTISESKEKAKEIVEEATKQICFLIAESKGRVKIMTHEKKDREKIKAQSHFNSNK